MRLGTKVAQAMTAIGIKPCDGCKRRAAALDRLFHAPQDDLPATQVKVQSCAKAMLVRDQNGNWGTYKIRGGRLAEGQFTCSCTPNHEQITRQRYEDLCAGRQPLTLRLNTTAAVAPEIRGSIERIPDGISTADFLRQRLRV